MSSRLFVLVEGQTEETFVNEVLAPHLYQCGFVAVSARLMGNARQRNRRGGVRGWSEVRRDITRYLRQDASLIVTTLVDFYGLPHDPTNLNKVWPGRAAAGGLPFAQKAPYVEAAIAADIQQQMGRSWNAAQFIPFVIMHEFEGLLFSDCERFAAGIAKPELAPEFQRIRDAFNSPEEINDSPLTHPSMRVLNLVPEYEKPLFGNLAALEIGFDPIRSECPHFREWLKHLETVA